MLNVGVNMKITADDFYMEISEVLLAHKFVLDGKNRCDYSSGRRFFGLSFAVGGKAEYKFSSGQRYTAEGGDVVYLPADTAYTIITDGEYFHYTVNFTINPENSTSPFPTDEICILKTRSQNFYLNSFREMTEIWSERRYGYKMSCASLLYGMLSHFAQEKFVHGSLGAAYRRIKPAKDYIDADPTRPISIDMLASLCDMSDTNFRRAFLCELGQTPIRYRDGLLIALAKELLSAGFFSVSECAARCGFEDASYFGRFFKKHTGISPGEYKSVG